MSFKDLITFKWLRDLFTPARRAWIMKMLPYGLSAAEVLTGVDWDHDGAVAGRQKLINLLNLAPPAAREWLAKYDLFSNDGTLATVNMDAIRSMLAPHLKQTLVIVAIITKLVGLGIPIPHWGLVESLAQAVYERTAGASKSV